MSPSLTSQGYFSWLYRIAFLVCFNRVYCTVSCCYYILVNYRYSICDTIFHVDTTASIHLSVLFDSIDLPYFSILVHYIIYPQLACILQSSLYVPQITYTCMNTHMDTCDRIQDSLFNKSSVWLDYIELSTQLNQFGIFVEH